jgi:hypothetical protein
VQQPDQPDVQPHVAVEDVAELVRDDPLQFVARQPLGGPARHADHGVAGVKPAANALIPGSCSSRYTGGVGVPEAIAISSTTFRSCCSVGSVVSGVEQPPAELLGDDLAAAAQLGDLEEASAADHDERADDGEAREARDRSAATSRAPRSARRAQIAERGRQQQVDRHDDRQHGQREQHHEARRVAPRGVLALEEVGGHELGGSERHLRRLLDRLPSNSSSAASWPWPNMPAKITGGNVCL